MIQKSHFSSVIFYLLFTFCSFQSQAQLEKVFVETYYISDSNDATDTTGGKLEVGSSTYRLYIDLTKGSKLRKVYGDAFHPLKFSSSAVFFNNLSDGQSFGKDFSKNRYGDNTVALDTWITLGQSTKPTAGFANYGVPKTDDDDGSFIGGPNNDGGSNAISGGLLVNNDPLAGIPLTLSDGMDTLQTILANWGDYGFKDLITGNDSTIFGSIVADSVFVSYNAALQNSGVSGVVPDSNYILLAQLTTRGDISFELNIEVIDTNGAVLKYVANNRDTLLADEILFPGLTYPPVCGCTNGSYLEYSPAFSCLNMDSCKTLVVLGCMDPLACNFNPSANFPTNSTCCYPGACNNLDISLVCPTLNVINPDESPAVSIYPNPVTDLLHIAVSGGDFQPTLISVFDVTGRLILQNEMDRNATGAAGVLDVSGLNQGSYYIRISSQKLFLTKPFVKN
jgi:hypothetical protein